MLASIFIDCLVLKYKTSLLVESSVVQVMASLCARMRRDLLEGVPPTISQAGDHVRALAQSGGYATIGDYFQISHTDLFTRQLI